MKKTIDGIIETVKMQKTAILRIARMVPHPLYKKLIRKDNKLSIDTGDFSVKAGDRVRVVEVKPISKTKHFKILEVIK